MTASFVSRRTVLLGAGAATLTTQLGWAGAAIRWNGYNKAIVIDGLGGPGSLTAKPGQPLTDAAVKDTRDSGLTAVLLTVGSVGTMPSNDAFAEMVASILEMDREISRHPDTFVSIRPYLSGGKQPTAADVIRHLDHMIDVAGEDHVSLGTDGVISAAILDQKYKDTFAESTRRRKQAGIAAPGETEDGYLFASDLNTPRRFETLGQMLADKGYGATRIEKILGGNLMRVFKAAWGA